MAFLSGDLDSIGAGSTSKRFDEVIVRHEPGDEKILDQAIEKLGAEHLFGDDPDLADFSSRC